MVPVRMFLLKLENINIFKAYKPVTMAVVNIFGLEIWTAAICSLHEVIVICQGLSQWYKIANLRST